MSQSTTAVLEALLFIALALITGAVTCKVMQNKKYPATLALVLPISAISAVVLFLRQMKRQ